MNFQRLNEFLEKEKDRFNKGVTRGSSWLARGACGAHRWVPLFGQRSMVNFDRAKTELRRAGLGLDTGRVGPVWAGPAQTHVKRWLCPHGRLGSKRALAYVGVAHGEQRGGEL
jgi:hypothetical protein